MTSNITVVTQAMPWEANSISIGSVQPSSKTNENAGFTRASYQPFRLLVDDCRNLKQDGFVKVEILIPQEDIRAMSAHMDRGIEEIDIGPGFPANNPYMTNTNSRRRSLSGRESQIPSLPSLCTSTMRALIRLACPSTALNFSSMYFCSFDENFKLSLYMSYCPNVLFIGASISSGGYWPSLTALTVSSPLIFRIQFLLSL